MTTPIKLLLVEDQETDAQLIAKCLAGARLECSIHRVQTEEAFLKGLHEIRPNLILSDFTLPGFDGGRALELAIVHAAETPFIFVSGTMGEECAVDTLHRGATDYVLKSNLSRLAPAVVRALREADVRAARHRAEHELHENERRLRRLTRAYRMLSSIGSAVMRLRDRTELLAETCRIIVQQGGYARVVISLMDPSSKLLRRHADAGADSEALRAFDLAYLQIESDASICAAPVSEHILNELGSQPMLPGHVETLRAHGIEAFAALPLKVDGTAVGLVSLFSSHRGVFVRAELQALRELMANLGFALQYLARDEAVQFLSYFDNLTGLAKRTIFCQRLTQLLSADASGELSRAVLVFDVQQLSAINDSFGRYIGDRLLENVAARIKQVYGGEAAAYLGGGTFALTFARSIKTSETGRMMQDAAARLFSEPFVLDEHELRPAVRSGVAFYPHDADSAEKLVQSAEIALKEAQRDNERYLAFGMVRHRPTTRSLVLEGRLAGAMLREEFLLHYQPKIDIATGRVVGLEALLRWQDEQEGLVPPSAFIPLLERSGAIAEVGEWILQRVALDARRWCAEGLTTMRIAVNVSPAQLRRRDFVQQVLAIANSPTASHLAFDIEITESTLMQDLELCTRKLAELRAAGIGVAIDDFGTGYSSLGLLASLPIDTLKIDRTFVKAMTESEKGAVVVSTIVSLASAFQMRSVAEGVETTEQLSMLRSVGCDQAQGYLFARPTAAADVPRMLEQLWRRPPTFNEDGDVSLAEIKLAAR